MLDNHEDKSYFLLEWSAYASILKLEMQVIVYARGLLRYLLGKPLAKAPQESLPLGGLLEAK